MNYVYLHRFLIFKPLKTDNSLSLKQSVFLTGLSIRNPCPIKGRFGRKVPKLARLVWLFPNFVYYYRKSVTFFKGIFLVLLIGHKLIISFKFYFIIPVTPLARLGLWMLLELVKMASR